MRAKGMNSGVSLQAYPNVVPWFPALNSPWYGPPPDRCRGSECSGSQAKGMIIGIEPGICCGVDDSMDPMDKFGDGRLELWRQVGESGPILTR